MRYQKQYTIPRNMSGYLQTRIAEKEEEKEAIQNILFLPMVCGLVALMIPLMWIVGCR